MEKLILITANSAEPEPFDAPPYAPASLEEAVQQPGALAADLGKWLTLEAEQQKLLCGNHALRLSLQKLQEDSPAVISCLGLQTRL